MIKLWTDNRITPEIKENLKNLGCKPLAVSACEILGRPIASHPDMNILSVCGKRFARQKTFVRENREDVFVSQGSKPLSYPEEAALNAVCIRNDFICCEKTVYKPALKFARECGLNVIFVRQGYVKCNMTVVNETKNAIITEDDGIAKALCARGYNVLKLTTHSVSLEPFPCGFIGGASGTIGDAVLFTGHIALHPEAEKIRAFCRQFGKEPVSLGTGTLYDYGSLLAAEDGE